MLKLQKGGNSGNDCGNITPKVHAHLDIKFTEVLKKTNIKQNCWSSPKTAKLKTMKKAATSHQDDMHT